MYFPHPEVLFPSKQCFVVALHNKHLHDESDRFNRRQEIFDLLRETEDLSAEEHRERVLDGWMCRFEREKDTLKGLAIRFCAMCSLKISIGEFMGAFRSGFFWGELSPILKHIDLGCLKV